MERDTSRINLNIELFCSEHPTERLSMSFPPENKDRYISGHSAYEVNPKIYINPCPACEHKLFVLQRSIANIVDLTKLQELNEGR